MSNLPPGRIDPLRHMGNANDPHPMITQEDIEATRGLAKEDNRPGGEGKVRTLLAPWLGSLLRRTIAPFE